MDEPAEEAISFASSARSVRTEYALRSRSMNSSPFLIVLMVYNVKKLLTLCKSFTDALLRFYCILICLMLEYQELSANDEMDI
ncbi:hypothetical protein PN4B1_24570 [Paenibacillus naphthalenovorans]|nr:hypothetical protein PN4B1_24570 [Paenibacillus naphthalenovorans]